MPARSTTKAASVVAVAAFGLYGMTLVGEPGWGDASELALQATQLGLTHPPGYPTYTALGHFVALAHPEPAVALNAFAALTVVAALVAFVVIAVRLAVRPGVAIIASLLLAATPTVWDIAVSTEVYSLNLALLAWSLAMILEWSDTGRRGALLTAAALFGVSLGCYLANGLLVPGLVVALWCRPPRDMVRILGTFFGTALGVLALLLGMEFLRAQSVIPLGTEFLPSTAAGFVAYLTGAQYGALALPNHSLTFFVERGAEEAGRLAGEFVWVGIALGLFGLRSLWRGRRRVALALTLMFLANLGYFTFYDVDDYFTMMTPAYFVFGLWIALGVDAALSQVRGRPGRRILVGAVPVAITAILVLGQIDGRLARSRSREVTRFVDSAFATLPADAVVIAGWEKLTPLLYTQRVHGRRPDLTLVEREDDTRWYAFGRVEDWPYIDPAPFKGRPIFVDDYEPGPGGPYRLIGRRGDWVEISFG